MALKDILTIVDLGGEQTSARYAVDLSASNEAHVTGLAISFEPSMPAFAAAPMPVDYLQAAHDQAVEAAKKAAAVFEGIAEQSGAPYESRVEEILTGGPLENVLHHCRTTDMVVIGQDNPDTPEPMRELLIETILFESGVPTLIVPYINKETKAPKNVVVAWDGSSTASRAVHAALPILKSAEKVTVLIVEKRKNTTGQPGAELATYLARHGLNVTIDVISNPQTSVADTLLNYVSDNATDLVVMGGYGHSRMREFLFGGATREILAAMTVPVLMAH